MLAAKGRVHFHPDLDSRVHEMLARQLCALWPLQPEIAVASARLEDLHGNPVDRGIVATAQRAAAILVTADTKILAWVAAKAGRVQVLAF